MKTTKRMRKSLLILLVCLVLVLSLTGCGTSGNHATDDSTPTTDSTPPSETSDNSPSTTDDASTGEVAVTIEPQILYDANDIKVTLSDFGYDLKPAKYDADTGHVWLILSVENNREAEIRVSGGAFPTINGTMLDFASLRTEDDPEEFNTYIAQGETRGVRVELLFDGDPALPHISTIYSVGFDLSFSKPTVEYPPEYIDEDLYFQLSTSAAGDGQPEYVPSKAPLLDENGIKAYYLGSSYNDSTTDDDEAYCEYLLYIVNDTDQKIMGYMAEYTVDEEDAADYSLKNDFYSLLPHTTDFVSLHLTGGHDMFQGEDGGLEIETFQIEADYVPVLTGELTFEDYDDETVLASGQISLSSKDFSS